MRGFCRFARRRRQRGCCAASARRSGVCPGWNRPWWLLGKSEAIKDSVGNGCEVACAGLFAGKPAPTGQSRRLRPVSYLCGRAREEASAVV
ncbi:hypothetical protein GEV41_18880 [Pseudomonas putida]|nr:hypothetical protein GEV41_18880 [Pseudomonas putida]